MIELCENVTCVVTCVRGLVYFFKHPLCTCISCPKGGKNTYLQMLRWAYVNFGYIVDVGTSIWKGSNLFVVQLLRSSALNFCGAAHALVISQMYIKDVCHWTCQDWWPLGQEPRWCAWPIWVYSWLFKLPENSRSHSWNQICPWA